MPAGWAKAGVLFLLLAAPGGALADYRAACSEGTWEAWSRIYDAAGETNASHDRSNRRCFHGGRGEIAEYRSLDANNETVFRGVSVTIWDRDRARGRTLWAMVGTDGHTDIEQRWEAGRLVATGRGHDPTGRFRERAVTEFRPGGDHTFTMARSFDSGASWVSPANRIEYLRSGDAAGALPGGWSPPLAGFAPGLVGEGGRILLDGWAWGRFTRDPTGAPAGFHFATIVPDGEGGWVWRTIRWSYADGIVGVDEIALP